MRDAPKLPGVLNELIFAIQDGHLFDVVEAVRRSYEDCPWWAFLRRRRLVKSLYWLTVVCEAYRTGNHEYFNHMPPRAKKTTTPSGF